MDDFVKFQPKRDVPFFITVPSEFCYNFEDSSKMKWCEIFIPPRQISMLKKPYPSIVVEPEHVFYISHEDYYVFWINAGATLHLYYKQYVSAGSSKRQIISSESDSPEGILGRILQYEAYRNGRIISGVDDITSVIYDDYVHSGMTMLAFIKSLKK